MRTLRNKLVTQIARRVSSYIGSAIAFIRPPMADNRPVIPAPERQLTRHSWHVAGTSITPPNKVLTRGNMLDEAGNICGTFTPTMPIYRDSSLPYHGQFLSNWETLRDNDKAKPAYDPEIDGAATKQEVGYKRDGSLRKFTASGQYLNWPTNRCKPKGKTADLDYNDINPIDPDYWEQRLESEGLGVQEINSLSPSEFSQLENRTAYVDSPQQSMTGIVCDNLKMRPRARSHTVHDDYKEWYAELLKAHHAEQFKALQDAIPAGKGRRSKRVKGTDRWAMLRAAAKQAKAS